MIPIPDYIQIWISILETENENEEPTWEIEQNETNTTNYDCHPTSNLPHLNHS